MVVDMSGAQAGELARDPTVAFVEQDQVVSIANAQTGATWGLDRIDQRSLPLNGEYDYAASGSGVTAYIIDTGINFSHVEFSGRASMGDDEVTSGGDASDCNGHGTHVAGTIGGNVFGVAKSVRLVSVRVLDCSGSGTISGVIAGIDWVSQYKIMPAVANLSLGGGYSTSLNNAVEGSISAGVVYVVAAGNNAADACNYSPSSAPDALTVGATDGGDNFAGFSNSGSCIDISAPGVSITSAWVGSSTATNTISGTSMAAPHVSGVAALYLERNPTATPQSVRDAIVNGSTTNHILNLRPGTPDRLIFSIVTNGSPSPSVPVARFVHSCNGSICNFDATPSTGAASYSWDFGDGTGGVGVVISHTFGLRSTYTVTLTAEAMGGTDTATQAISCHGKKCT
jgi:Subtilisin-like serine proteases